MTIEAKPLNSNPITPPPTLKKADIFSLVKSERKGCPYSINSITFSSGGTIDEQTHDDEHFIYVAAGTIDITIGGTEHSISEGKYIYVPGNINHSFVNKTDARATIIILKI